MEKYMEETEVYKHECCTGLDSNGNVYYKLRQFPYLLFKVVLCTQFSVSTKRVIFFSRKFCVHHKDGIHVPVLLKMITVYILFQLQYDKYKSTPNMVVVGMFDKYFVVPQVREIPLICLVLHNINQQGNRQKKLNYVR